MKVILLSTVSVLALAFGASAADLPVRPAPPPIVKAPPPPIVSWTGFYLGIQGGAAWHEGKFVDLNGAFDPTTAASTYKADKTGGIFGVNAGYNLQSGNLVVGLEGDTNWVGAKATSSNPQPGSCGSPCAVLSALDVRWLATVRARVGLAVDATLFYATGGVAFGGVRDTGYTTLNGAPTITRFDSDKTKTGWTAGGGIEHMFGPNWTARAEVRYVDFGKTNVACTPAPCSFGYRGEFANSLVTGLVAVDFKF